MNYKSILEGQISELQKVQDSLPKDNPEYSDNACYVAEQIMKLVIEASKME